MAARRSGGGGAAAWLRRQAAAGARVAALALALWLPVQSAHADLWAYVDDRGVTHFAAERIDERYSLFFRGDVFDSTKDGRATGTG
ncbi:DUF4124 domain-containing protein, partial [Rhizobium leguminosarum]|uniref:DUF4124 domain-containing protein n=2 Tax=Pseudomonadota TaxID=1224 RepID=UPI0013DEF750